jgi:malonyl CoA-acyl carrier protein transacylase/phosphopantetheinyl transferase
MPREMRAFHRAWPAEVCTFAACTRDELVAQLTRLAAFLNKNPTLALKDLAYSLNMDHAREAHCRLAFVSSNLQDAKERVDTSLERLSRPECQRINDARGLYFEESLSSVRPKCSFLFPGENSQYVGMLSDLCLWFPQVRAWFDLMDRTFVDHPRGYLPSELVFPLADDTGADPAQSKLWQVDGAVECVFAASQAMLSLLKGLGVQPDAVAGHSSGDYSALFAAGVFRIAGDLEFVRLARDFNDVYEEFSALGGVPSGVLLIINNANPRLVQEVIGQSEGKLNWALDNCPHQAVLCGTEGSVKHAADVIRNAGSLCDILPFARAYHTSAFEPVSEKLYAVLRNIELCAPEVPAYSCVTGEPYPEDPEQIRKLAAIQWARTVRFRETIENMYEAGIRVFVEAGPRSNLTAFVTDILRGRPHTAVASNMAGRPGMVQLQHVAAQLFVAGVPVRLDQFYANRSPQRIPFQPGDREKAAPQSSAPKLSLRLPALELPARARSRASQTLNPAIAQATASERASQDTRSQVLESFFQNTMKMLQTEREVMTEFLRPKRPLEVSASAAERSPTNDSCSSDLAIGLPFVTKILSLVPGKQAIVWCEIDVQQHLFLRQHTLAGKITSTNDDVFGVPVIPLTVSMEIVAEVASLLARGCVVTGMKDLRASRWLTVEGQTLSLLIEASSENGGGDVRVALREAHPDESEARRDGPALEATVTLAPMRDGHSTRAQIELPTGRASKWQAGKMYERTGMFHGPLFQVVSAMNSTSKEGAEASLVGCSLEGFFRTESGQLLIDPVMLDAMGQVVGYWVGDQFETALSVFPCRLASLELFRVPLQPGEKATCRVQVLHVDEHWIRSNIEVVTSEGMMIARMNGWEDRRLDLPRRFYDFRITPAEVFLSDSWNLPVQSLPAPETFRCAVLDPLPQETFESHGSIWLLVLAYMVLNPWEREQWQVLKGSGRRRLEWLQGRIAAKDAVRRLLWDTDGVRLCPADIEIWVTESGVPAVRLAGKQTGLPPPSISISHARGKTIAIAGRPGWGTGIGIDLERIGRITDEVAQLVLSSSERELLDSMDEATRSEWATRIWCAKEAVGKAMGLGLVPGSDGIEAGCIDRASGCISIFVSPQAGMGSLQGVKARFTAYTGSDGAHAFGTAVI